MRLARTIVLLLEGLLWRATHLRALGVHLVEALGDADETPRNVAGIMLADALAGFEPEFTVKVARTGRPIYEVGISYYGRSYAEGKKITWRDGVETAWCLVRFGLLRR